MAADVAEAEAVITRKHVELLTAYGKSHTFNQMAHAIVYNNF